MEPVYFPFTYINGTVARDLYAYFGRVTVYQPSAHNIPENMQRLAKEGVLDLRIPVSGDEARLEAVIKEYKEWGELHQKSDTAFVKAMGGGVPFFDDTFSTQLASQIKKIRDENYSKEKPDILFNTRLFLCLAQDYDIMQDGINRDLISVYEMGKKLLEGLTHEDGVFFSKNTGSSLQSADDSGKYKIKERIEAWIYLMSKDREKPRFFITGSRDAFDFVIEKAGDITKVIELDSVPVCAQADIMNKWRNMFIGQAEGLYKDDNFKIDEKICNMPAAKEPESEPKQRAHSPLLVAGLASELKTDSVPYGRRFPAACGGELQISLKIFRIINKSRRDFFNNILEKDFQDVMINNNDEINKSIFICLSELLHPT